MRKVVIVTGAVGILLIVGVLVMLSANPTRQQPDRPFTSVETSTQKTAPTMNESVAAGRYEAYSDDAVRDTGYATTVLFFHAAWCIECRAFEKELTGAELPAGVQVLKIDYDSRQDLRQKYGVTTQTTFVRVDANGLERTKWVGYGKDKTITAIVENTK